MRLDNLPPTPPDAGDRLGTIGFVIAVTLAILGVLTLALLFWKW